MEEYSNFNQSEKIQTVKSIVQSINSPMNGEIKELQAKIDQFEIEFGINSKTLHSKIKNGEQEETMDICEWLMLLKQLDYYLVLNK